MKNNYTSIFMTGLAVILSFTLSGQNLLLNPSFESGILAPWVAGNGNTVNIIDDSQHGDWAAQGNIEQIVQLEAGVKYIWTTQAKCLGGCEMNIWIGIKDLVADQLVTNFLINDYGDYQEAKIEFEAASSGDHRFWVWGVADTDYISDNHILIQEGTTNTSETDIEKSKINITSDGQNVRIDIDYTIDQADITIFDLTGKAIYNNTAQQGTTTINMNEFVRSGMYVVTVKTDKAIQAKQVVISN